MKIFSLLIAFSFLVPLSATPLEELRKEYMKALSDADQAPEVYELFLKVENPSAKVLAYRGALEAILTRTTYNVFKKVNYLKKSKKSFEEAVKKDPNNLEIRFMRLAVEHEIPDFLGMSENIESDREFVIKNIDRFKAENFPKPICKQILSFMKKCNYFTANQIQKFKGHLALN